MHFRNRIERKNVLRVCVKACVLLLICSLTRCNRNIIDKVTIKKKEEKLHSKEKFRKHWFGAPLQQQWQCVPLAASSL